MSITSLTRDDAIGVNIVRMVTSDTLATAFAADYLTDQLEVTTELNKGVFEWLEGDMVAVSASDGNNFAVFDGDDFSTLILYSTAGNGAVTLPVVDGDFTVFDSTLGALKDAGYSASDAAKTKVVMASAAVLANHIACFADTSGTINDDSATAINGGNIQAGLSGTAGYLASFPATGSKGSLRVVAVANINDDIVSVSNAAHGQASVYSIPDGGQSTANLITSESKGTQTIATGNVALTAGYVIKSAANALTAHVGGGQGSALQLAKQINRVTTVASAGDSVKLPAAVAGYQVTVINAAAANAMDVFPQTGEIINALSANTALSVAANKTIIFTCAVAGTWNSLLTA